MIWAPSASAVTIQTSDSSHPWQSWSDAAQVPTYAGTLPLAVAPDYVDCGGFTDAAGCTSITPTIDGQTGSVIGPPTVTTEIDGGQDIWDDRQTLYHELGQIFWSEYMTDSDETQFMRIVGLPGDASSWGNWSDSVTINGVLITFAPFEWFAEGYRYCAEYGVNQPAGVSDEEGVGYPGDKATFATQQREVCELIDTIGLRQGLVTPTQANYTPTRLSGRVMKVRVRLGQRVPKTIKPNLPVGKYGTLRRDLSAHNLHPLRLVRRVAVLS
ncbi:MAG TPA: hypothetical protein VGF91_03935 [Solirubrobacteraceae bacterium]